MDRRGECGKTSNVLELSFDEGKILLNVTDAMLENCAHCQLYVEDLNDGMHKKLLCMLRENPAKPSTSAKHGTVLMKDAKVLNRSDGDCSTKWRNLKALYNQLLLSSKKKSSRQSVPWPYMAKMNLLLKNNPTVKLEHVTEVVDGVLKESTSKYNGITGIGMSLKKTRRDYRK
ncbi:hypothetical protein DAPPUDRAFT_327669 [Daphnia pulex]|uniref:MADF domain-containing protein n=1 Tax=Daphnia pulex TaxID=6669 RepID=E9HBD5_DAPPU|nr:hypothetical protein DAPPUDRAFT_327669 [Daphnia pulex]|eukprot:EFX70963.1 hypothetical protein DAPPUDRAFT_327669 [Daphnia pulex]